MQCMTRGSGAVGAGAGRRGKGRPAHTYGRVRGERDGPRFRPPAS